MVLNISAEISLIETKVVSAVRIAKGLLFVFIL